MGQENQSNWLIKENPYLYNMRKEFVDILIIGAGPSGSVAASIAHRSGLKVKIVEKNLFPRFVIGESLLPKCMADLKEAGFMDILEAQNYQKKFGARFIRNDQNCLFDFSEQYTDGWSWTWQVPRADFDQVLAKEVEKMGVSVSYESTLTDISFEGSTSVSTIQEKDGASYQIEAKFVIDSSGWGRVLPRLLDLDKPISSPPRKAIFAHFTDNLRPKGDAGNQITFVIHKQDLWTWIIPFSNGLTSVGFVGNIAHFENFEGSPDERIKQMIDDVPQMKERFTGQEIKLDAMEISAYAASAKQLYGPGFAITGNSSEFIDPVFSSGVTFATHSGLLAAKLAIKTLNGEDVNWEDDFKNHILQGVETFRTYVDSWYDGTLQDIFFYTSETAKDNPTNATMKKQICSVLAGYVWDETNPFVKKHKKAVSSLARVIKMF